MQGPVAAMLVVWLSDEWLLVSAACGFNDKLRAAT